MKARARWGVLLLLVMVASLTFGQGAALASPVHSGYDNFQTVAPTQQNFSLLPIPADFFDPGSEPFQGVIQFLGEPLGPDSTADTIVARQDTAKTTGRPPVTVTIPIEIVALSLVSVNPITVTYPDLHTEQWDVKVTLSPTQIPQPTGQMTVTHLDRSGGTFSSTLPVVPLFTFVRPSDGAVRELDLGLEHLPPIEFGAQDIPWSHDTPRDADTKGRFCPGCVNGQPLPFSHQAFIAIHSVILASKR
ncbi:MAG: hypothetical protein HYU30_05330 [Chloroflexi bacterium]|nr:hypothetical protein [Chloroflexota bacterium]